ncbi:hypothetical protein SAMN05444375_10347 [Segatella baroniae B14]|jgi:hypothetical protein|nr:hypothetical protein SAMN05216455_105137 [Segatella bryantii]SEP82194.1 hypothetical protein SAMN05444375_10347 [Segatella baroniae B14]
MDFASVLTVFINLLTHKIVNSTLQNESVLLNFL